MVWYRVQDRTADTTSFEIDFTVLEMQMTLSQKMAMVRSQRKSFYWFLH